LISNIGEGTVSGIVSEFKIGVDNSEFDSAREFALEVRKQGLTMSELSSHVRLNNFIKTSGGAEEGIESFIVSISSSSLPLNKSLGF
jgi:hypothetical protein